MVSDFFYPNFGGVENHIYQLSQCLIDHGHHVVIMTHSYEDRKGVRYLTNGLKVYYIPRLPFYASATVPTLVGTFRLLRCILIRERIQLIHAHQAFSVLGNEAMLHGRTMGYPVVFTDHSLFGFADAASICTNKLLKWTLCDVQQTICVSHTSKENTVLRACLPPARVSVIPNAVDTAKFRPFPRPETNPSRIIVVILNRLVYRKGIDLQVAIIPHLCKRWPQMDFVIGGDGPKRQELEAMVRQHGLASRVRLAGSVQHEDARALLVQGDIFLNTSLTEAFCMAIVEAASAGLLVVSTDVGGVPEVLPRDMSVLAAPEPRALVAAMATAVEMYRTVDRQRQHDRVTAMYSWDRVASRTEVVYGRALQLPTIHDAALRLQRLRLCGPIFGLFTVLFSGLASMWHRVAQWLDPECGIEQAVDMPRPSDARRFLRSVVV